MLPRDEKFFDLFVDQAATLLDAAKALESANRDAIAGFEAKGDEQMRNILDRLNQTFITPIDPEDVSEIATGLETLIDHIESLGFRVSLGSEDGVECNRKFVESAETILEIFKKLQRDQMKSKESVMEDCGKVRCLIGEAIKCSRDRLKHVFDTEKDAIALIRSKDVSDWAEITARGFEKFSETLQTILSKNV